MKKLASGLAFLIFSLTASAQILLEDIDGDVVVHNQFYGNQKAGNLSLVRLNTGDQSLGFTYFKSTILHDPRKYSIHAFGVKALPTEGYAAVLRNGQFTPGLHLSYTLTRVSIFSQSTLSPFIDWAGVQVGYDINKYVLYSRNTSFDNQFYVQPFRGVTLLGYYNLLLKSKWIASLKGGYQKRNNYDDLDAVEVNDIATITSPGGTVRRQITQTRTAHEGDYAAFDAYPISIALTRATATDDPASPAANQLRFGYSVYLKSLLSKNLPQTHAGVIFFLTRQNKGNGVRSPVFGLNIESNDPFDVKQLHNDWQNRLVVGFTSIFSL